MYVLPATTGILMVVISLTLVGICAIALTAMAFSGIIFLITIVELEQLIDLIVRENSAIYTSASTQIGDH